jgi:hypothetical protein
MLDSLYVVTASYINKTDMLHCRRLIVIAPGCLEEVVISLVDFSERKQAKSLKVIRLTALVANIEARK